jgi:hypothetical protein
MIIYNMIMTLASQIKKASVKLPKAGRPHKIKDNNQSIKNGVVNEKSHVDLRSPS